MDYEHKQREAFYLIKKYSSYTWYAEIYRQWKLFCDGHEELLRHPEIHLKGWTDMSWWEDNMRAFWGYAAEMEEGLALLRQGNKARGYEYLASGTRFYTLLYSRRFGEMDLSKLGYRQFKADGANQGIFAYAEIARDMAIANAIRRDSDDLRRDVSALPNNYYENRDIPIAIQHKTPFGVPPGELASLPALTPNAPTVMSGEEVPAMGIWGVEPDEAHRDQSYCMAYLRPWAPALLRVSEQEYEKNSRWERTDDEAYRKDSDKIKDYPVKWRLLWQDDRDYSNGNVPPEEADYLIYREPSSMSETDPEIVRLRCEGGQPCPRTGIWQTPASKDSRRMFKAGDTMPDYPNAEYGLTIWQWDENQDR